MADSTKSGSAVVTVTLRTITINSASGNNWLANCSGTVVYNVTQSGIVAGDTFYVDPYQSSPVTSSLPATFPIILGIGNAPPNVCSPGAYNEYVKGTDGAVSNTHYVPVLDRWNTWAGYDTTDEYQADYAGKAIHKYKLPDGTQDGADLPLRVQVAIIDGANLVWSNLGNLGIGVSDAATGTFFNGNNRSGDNIVGVAAKNGIIGYTTNQEVSFFLEFVGGQNVADVSSVGTGPAAIAMSKGCSSDPNTATAFVYDEAGSTLYRADAVGTPVDQNGSATVSASKIGGGVYLSGLSPASAAPKTLARYVVAWDNTCKAAVLAPIVTGTNPDGSTAYNVELALLDMTAGSMRQLGTYVFSTTVNNVTTTIPSTAIRVAADPAGNDVIVASTNESAGTTILTKIAWTLDSSENPTFTVTTLNSVPPVGIYGVSLGVLPNGKISVGQRQQHFVLAAQ
jgi:hypothetical protein